MTSATGVGALCQALPEFTILADQSARGAENANRGVRDDESRLVRLLEWPGDLKALDTLTDAEVARLVRIYKRLPLEKRWSAQWILGYSGREIAFATLTNTIFGEYRGTTVSIVQAGDVYQTLEAIGLIARTNETTFAFLKRGMTNEFWKGTRTWKAEELLESASLSSLVGYSIAGLAFSGRPEVKFILADLKRHEHETCKLCQPTAVEAAAFYYDTVTSDREPFLRAVLTEGTMGQSLQKMYWRWMTTKSGKEWSEWPHKALSLPTE